MIKTRTTRKREFQMYCNCGCHEGVILYYDADPDDDNCPMAFLSLVGDHFSMEQKTGLRRLFEKLKRIWFIICNKEYCYFEMVVTKDEIAEFKRFVSLM